MFKKNIQKIFIRSIFPKNSFVKLGKRFYSANNQSEKIESESDSSKKDEYLNKDFYLKKLIELREKEEKEQEENQKLHEDFNKMKKREYEVSLAKIDFAKISTENINLIPKESFSSVDELFYFLKNATNRISEKNIQKCIQGLLSLSEKIGSQDLENIYYKQFLNDLKDNINTISEPENYLLIANFLDLFCVDDSKLWERLERKVLNRAQAIPLKSLIQIFLHFANQKEGSEYFYDRSEELFKANYEKMDFQDLFQVFQGYFSAQFGTKEFIEALVSELKKKIDEGSPQNLIKICYWYNNAQNPSLNFITLLEEKVLEKIDQLNFDDFANCGLAFGEREIHGKLFKIIEENIIKNFQEIDALKIKQTLEALVFNYKGSINLFNFLQPHILSNLTYFEYADLAKISKAYYIKEAIDPHDSFFFILERRIVQHLKDLKNVKNEELIEFVKCYCIARNGSREFYKLLELVVEYKIGDLVKVPDYIKTLHQFYSTSGFCSAEFLKRLEFLL